MGEGVGVLKGGEATNPRGWASAAEVDAMNLDKVNANPGRIGTQRTDEVIGQDELPTVAAIPTAHR
jgi:hypothetical protein